MTLQGTVELLDHTVHKLEKENDQLRRELGHFFPLFQNNSASESEGSNFENDAYLSNKPDNSCVDDEVSSSSDYAHITREEGRVDECETATLPT